MRISSSVKPVATSLIRPTRRLNAIGAEILV